MTGATGCGRTRRVRMQIHEKHDLARDSRARSMSARAGWRPQAYGRELVTAGSGSCLGTRRRNLDSGARQKGTDAISLALDFDLVHNVVNPACRSDFSSLLVYTQKMRKSTAKVRNEMMAIDVFFWPALKMCNKKEVYSVAPRDVLPQRRFGNSSTAGACSGRRGQWSRVSLSGRCVFRSSTRLVWD